MKDLTEAAFFTRNNTRITDIAHNLIHENIKKITLGKGFFLQLFRFKKGEDKGLYVLLFELNKVSLDEVQWKVVKGAKFDSVDEYLDMKLMMKDMKVDVEKLFKQMTGN